MLRKGASLHAGLESGDLWKECVEGGNKEIFELLRSHGLKENSEPETPIEEPSEEDE
jgi:hypothetical protein